MSSRRSGILVPLFSFPSTTSWGIGEIRDVVSMAAWLAGGGQRILQLLPLNEMASGECSPYSALSAMAIDPIFISLAEVPEFAALGGESSLSSADRDALDEARRARSVDYRTVRFLKGAALERAFERFRELEWCRDSARAARFRAYVEAEAWWLEEYALFRAIHAREANRAWTAWPEPLRQRDPATVEETRRNLSDRVLFYQYLQWIADAQWLEARAGARALGVELYGDLPFMVDGDSADVWVRQADFDLELSTGVPPDAFSATGQDWGTPVYRWDTIAAGDFGWLRARTRRSAELYDGYRIDHLVGFYRTYARPRNGSEPFFTPAEEPEQLALGERLLSLFRERGSEIIAEDLGTVPDFVRKSLSRLAVPGFRVFRWERQWHTEGQPFRDLAEYPLTSVATTGTHDTEPLACWWDTMPVAEHRQIDELPSIQRLAPGPLPDLYDWSIRDTLLEALFSSGSDLLLLPIQDVFGWRERINEPATVTPANWTFRLRWPVDQLQTEPEACERQAKLRVWSERYARTGVSSLKSEVSSTSNFKLQT